MDAKGPSPLARDGFMEAWSKHENAPRTPCPTCAFESSEGYPASHAPDCPEADVKGSK